MSNDAIGLLNFFAFLWNEFKLFVVIACNENWQTSAEDDGEKGIVKYC